MADRKHRDRQETGTGWNLQWPPSGPLPLSQDRLLTVSTTPKTALPPCDQVFESEVDMVTGPTVTPPCLPPHLKQSLWFAAVCARLGLLLCPLPISPSKCSTLYGFCSQVLTFCGQSPPSPTHLYRPTMKFLTRTLQLRTSFFNV